MAEPRETVGAGGELLGDEAPADAGVVLEVAELPVVAKVPGDSVVTAALVAALLGMAEGEPVAEDPPVVPLVVVVPPDTVVVVEPVLPPLEETELDGAG